MHAMSCGPPPSIFCLFLCVAKSCPCGLVPWQRILSWSGKKPLGRLGGHLPVMGRVRCVSGAVVRAVRPVEVLPDPPSAQERLCPPLWSELLVQLGWPVRRRGPAGRRRDTRKQPSLLAGHFTAWLGLAWPRLLCSTAWGCHQHCSFDRVAEQLLSSVCQGPSR